MWILFLLALLPTPTENNGEPQKLLEHIDPAHFKAYPLKAVMSPTALAIMDETLYVACDTLEERPGIYRLLGEYGKNGAGLAVYLPQTDIEGLVARENFFDVACSRVYSPYPEDWKARILSIDMKTRRQVDTLSLDMDGRCGDDTFNCGLIGVHKLDNGKMLVVTKQNIAELHLLALEGNRWKKEISLPITVDSKFSVITEFHVINETLVFLVRNRWLLSAAPLKAIYEEGAWRLDTQQIFDLSQLSKRFAVSNAEIKTQGFAEGFVIDKGKLVVLLNNRGYEYDISTEVFHKQPLLVVYEPPAAEAKEDK